MDPAHLLESESLFSEYYLSDYGVFVVGWTLGVGIIDGEMVDEENGMNRFVGGWRLIVQIVNGNVVHQFKSGMLRGFTTLIWRARFERSRHRLIEPAWLRGYGRRTPP